MVVTIRSNIANFSNEFSNFESEFKEDLGNVLERVAIRGKKEAILNAPEKSGDLKKGIFMKVFKKQLKAHVASVVFGDFPYNFWINEEAGFTPITWKRKNRWFRTDLPIRYGQSGELSSSFKSVRWTGKPRFFSLAAEVVSKNSTRYVWSYDKKIH